MVTICGDGLNQRTEALLTDGPADQRTESIVQQLYATGLSLQMCLDGPSTPNQRHRLESAIEVLDGLITELGMQPLAPGSTD